MISDKIVLVDKWNDASWGSISFFHMKNIKEHWGQILHLLLFDDQRTILLLTYWYFNDVPVLGNTPRYKRKGVYARRKTISDIVELSFYYSRHSLFALSFKQPTLGWRTRNEININTWLFAWSHWDSAVIFYHFI